MGVFQNPERLFLEIENHSVRNQPSRIFCRCELISTKWNILNFDVIQ